MGNRLFPHLQLVCHWLSSKLEYLISFLPIFLLYLAEFLYPSFNQCHKTNTEWGRNDTGYKKKLFFIRWDAATAPQSAAHALRVMPCEHGWWCWVTSTPPLDPLLDQQHTFGRHLAGNHRCMQHMPDVSSRFCKWVDRTILMPLTLHSAWLWNDFAGQMVEWRPNALECAGLILDSLFLGSLYWKFCMHCVPVRWMNQNVGGTGETWVSHKHGLNWAVFHWRNNHHWSQSGVWARAWFANQLRISKFTKFYCLGQFFSSE